MDTTKRKLIDKAQMMQEIAQLISEGKTVSITAKGYSMNPFVRHLQDILTIGPFEDSDIRKGTAALVRTTKGEYVFQRETCVYHKSKYKEMSPEEKHTKV